jgi:hypothetical protein
MKKLVYTLSLLGILSACSDAPNEEVATVAPKEVETKAEPAPEPTDPCDFPYDTISNERYMLHLSIIEKFYNEEKRGYAFDQHNDTLNKFLYHQDISVFVRYADPSETGIYKLLTNKVVFMMLEYDPKMLDAGLTLGMPNELQLDYFLEHVANPVCHTQPIEKTIGVIEEHMAESSEAAIAVKKRILEQLEKAK